LKKLGMWLIKITASTGLVLLISVFSIILAGVFLARAKEGRQAADALLTRLTGKEHGKEMTDLLYLTVTSVVRGILGVALIQALFAGIGLLAIGIPGAGFLTLICLILAVVQIEIMIILIPLSIYAFSFAGTGAAVAFLIWNIFVGFLNNILKPLLLGRGVDTPMPVIFIGAIGGLLAMGIIGLFVGAIILVLSWTLFTQWLLDKNQSVVTKQE